MLRPAKPRRGRHLDGLPARLLLQVSAVGVAVACGSVSPGHPPAPIPVPDVAVPSARPPAVVLPALTDPAPSLPAVPEVRGPLNPRVVYPPRGQLITSRDSNFIFGSVGSGDATLRINGAPVPVLPNGAFLAFLAVPPGDRPVYRLDVTRGADTARLEHRVAVLAPRLALPDTGRLVVDSASLTPRAGLAARSEDWVRVSVRAPRNARATLVMRDGVEVPLVSPSEATAEIGGATTTDPFLWNADVTARLLTGPGAVHVVRGADTLRLALPIVAAADGAGRRFAVLGAAPAQVPDTDRVVIVRPVPAGTYKWFLLPGTVVEVTGRSGGFTRIRLDAALDGWVDSLEVALLPPGFAPARRVAENARVVAGDSSAWSDVVIPMADRPPYAVDVTRDGLAVTLYGVYANTDIVNHPTGDPVVRRVAWEQLAADRARFTIETLGAPWGYLVRWERGALVIRVRSAPRLNRGRSLDGIVIAVDAGHPPIGSTGPTGLYEAEATLAVANRVQRLLEARGARVLMTRTTSAPVALNERPVMARRAGAHLFVSIHLNALPDGVNPFRAHGTGTYYFTPQSVDLARHVQRGMVQRMGLRDLGINYDNLAVLRPTWMPAVLCEGAFIMIPEQEAALRTPEFQERYALGVVEGLESYLRSIAR